MRRIKKNQALKTIIERERKNPEKNPGEKSGKNPV